MATMTIFKLTTWNVENLFRPPAGATREERRAYREKLAFLAETLDALSPDVVAVQEVGSPEALHDLQKELGTAFPHCRVGTQDGRGISVGFLSKLAFREEQDITLFPPSVAALRVSDANGRHYTSMGRGALRVRVKKGSFTTDLLNVHLKSKLLSFPLPNGETAFSTGDEDLRASVAAVALLRRTAEATTVRLAANEIVVGNPVQALAVLGDFNDGPNAATTQIVQGPGGSEVDTAGFDRPDERDDSRLWNLAPCIPSERRFSRIHHGQGELLDQIFVSEEYLPRLPETQKRQRPLQVDALIETIRSIGDNPKSRTGEVQPDHAPVSASFRLLRKDVR
jgi:endonuclease/exonuclease/phosphatase family metal-dependent hydrolase